MILFLISKLLKCLKVKLFSLEFGKSTIKIQNQDKFNCFREIREL